MRWGLIGASTIASEHVIAAIRAQPGIEIAGVLSGTARAARTMPRGTASPQSTTDLDALLGDPAIDAVYISTTNEKHHPQALAAIAAGKHVLCEKPLAMTAGRGGGDGARRRGEGRGLRDQPPPAQRRPHLAIRELIADGRIGRVLSVRVFHAVHLPPHLQGWRINDAAAGGGVIPDIAVHDADTVRFYLDEDPAEVVAMAGASGMGEGVEDSVMSVWTMPSGAMVQTHESFTHPLRRVGRRGARHRGLDLRARDHDAEAGRRGRARRRGRAARDRLRPTHDLYAPLARPLRRGGRRARAGRRRTGSTG